MRKGSPWTRKELQDLETMYADRWTAPEDLTAGLPGRTLDSIRSKASRIGLKRPTLPEPERLEPEGLPQWVREALV